jgi:hypothetical protein
MTDKNVLNYHIPADFNPDRLLPSSALQNRNIGGPKTVNLRMMLPFTMKCDSCNQYISVGTKFTAKSLKLGEEFGIDVYRFYAKCKWCSSEFVFRSEPKISDYILESGGVRQYEHSKDVQIAKAIDEKSDASSDDEESQQQKIVKEVRGAETLETLKAKARSLGADREATIDRTLENLKRQREQTDDDYSVEWKRLRQDIEKDEASQEYDGVCREIFGSSQKNSNNLLAAYDSDSDSV